MYSLCFSTVKSCRYWNDETIESIIENAKVLHEKLCFTKQTAQKLIFPSKLDIGMGHVNIAAGTKVQGILSFDSISKNNLKMCILENMESNSGFLLWVSSYCISCM